MIRSITFLAVAGVCLSASLLRAQPPEFPKPEKEHQWLQKFVGEWDTQSEAFIGPNQPALKCEGKMTCRGIGGFWVVNEMTGDVGGMPMHGVQTIGYDAAKKKYVGTWVDSMAGYMWKYEGSVDKAGNKISLDAEGPNFMAEGKMAKFRDAYEFKSADEILATSAMQGDDGQWITFMTGTMRRKK